MDEFARSLLSHERKEWQDPERIVPQIEIGRGAVVADLGCGPGFFTIPLAKTVGEGGKVYAVDSSAVMLDYLRTNIKRSRLAEGIVQIGQSDVSKTSIPPRSVNFVIFANILHDVEPGPFLGEVRRISKENARIVDIDWKDVDNGFGPPRGMRLSKERARDILSTNGLTVRGEIDPGPYHYGLVCELSK